VEVLSEVGTPRKEELEEQGTAGDELGQSVGKDSGAGDSEAEGRADKDNAKNTEVGAGPAPGQFRPP
jgi:hypothetical protein